jgi:hypothetical protein
LNGKAKANAGPGSKADGTRRAAAGRPPPESVPYLGTRNARPRGPVSPGQALALQRMVGNRIARQLLHPPGPTLQRRVLTIGAVDAEVRFSKARLLEDTGMAEGVFEDEKHLRDDQPEIILGHGTEGTIAGKDAAAIAGDMEKKMLPESPYHVVFMACKAGMPLQQASSLAKTVYDTLKAKGFTLTIEAPRGIALVLANQKYLVTSDFPSPHEVDIPTQVPKEALEVDVPDAESGIWRSITPIGQAKQSVLRAFDQYDSILRAGVTSEPDATRLRQAQWTNKRLKARSKNSVAVTPYDVLEDALRRRRAQLLETNNLASVTTTYSVLSELETGQTLELLTGAEFRKWVDDLEQEYDKAKMRQKVADRRSSSDSLSTSTGSLDPAHWEKSGTGSQPSPSYYG